MADSTPLPVLSKRIASIDVFRGLTMFFMLWVNSFWSLSEVPHWLLHAARNEDMLGFSDVIFPAFLFIVGASIPIAIDNRLKKGSNVRKTVFHIMIRAFALIVMGLFTVNFGDAYNAQATGIARGGYAILMVVGFFLVWNAYPRSERWTKHLYTILKILGAGLLVYLAVVFRGDDGSTFGVRWWGILGRIGWTYLFCSLVFLTLRRCAWWNLTVLGILIAGSLLQAAGTIPGKILPNQLTIFAYGMSGIALTLLLKKFGADTHKFYLLLLAAGAGMLLAGLWAHNHWIVSKIAATPTWYFYCCAIFFPFFGLLHYLTDVKGKTRWFAWVMPAGTAALSCYVAAYAWNPLKNMIFNSPLLRPEFSVGILGLVNSFCYALLLIWAVWLLMRIHIQLKV